MVFTFAGVVGTFIDTDWRLVERLIDFHHLNDDEHKGVHAAHAFMRSGSKRGSLNKMSDAPFSCRLLSVSFYFLLAQDTRQHDTC